MAASGRNRTSTSEEHKVKNPKLEKEEDMSIEEKGVCWSKQKKAAEHKQQLERLQEKDPEFYEFLIEHDKELLDFDDEDIDVDDETDGDSEEMEEDEEENNDVDNEEDISQSGIAAGMSEDEEEETSSKNVITIAMVDSWCTSIQESSSLAAVRSLMKAFRVACHYGDDGRDNAVCVE